jgi:hypothetical protein
MLVKPYKSLSGERRYNIRSAGATTLLIIFQFFLNQTHKRSRVQSPRLILGNTVSQTNPSLDTRKGSMKILQPYKTASGRPNVRHQKTNYA